MLAREECVLAFIEAGADIEDVDGQNGTALEYASQVGRADIVGLLLSAGANVNRHTGGLQGTALHYAACIGHLATVETLLAHGADVSAADVQGHTPLHTLAVADPESRRKMVEAIEKLLVFYVGQNHHAKPKNPLEDYDGVGVAEALFRAGAKADTLGEHFHDHDGSGRCVFTDKEGRSAMKIALHQGNYHIASVISKHVSAMKRENRPK